MVVFEDLMRNGEEEGEEIVDHSALELSKLLIMFCLNVGERNKTLYSKITGSDITLLLCMTIMFSEESYTLI